MEEHARLILEHLATVRGHCALPDIALLTEMPEHTAILALEALIDLGYAEEHETVPVARCFSITDLGRAVLEAERKGR